MRRQETLSWAVAIRKRDHPDVWGSHGIEGHPPDKSLRWDETPLVTIWPTSNEEILQIQL